MNRIVTGAFRRAYLELISNRRRQMPFWMLIGFLPTFIMARLLVQLDPNLFLHIHGIHVHHFTYGILVLAVVGFIAIVSGEHPYRPWLAIGYGIGLALSFDEFGMWVRLTDNYSLDQSEDIMVGILVFFVIIVYFFGILRRALRILKRLR
ncbi:MAG: hypothetical protein JWN01_1223 [Patescibacteria group bacterium]|nr:hypothetical protein [Patescibacteria group bacterium]